jgi:hypothetical protein
MKMSRAAAGTLAGARMLVRALPRLLPATTIGVALATAAFLAGPWLASALSGGGGFAAALAAQLAGYRRAAFGDRG